MPDDRLPTREQTYSCPTCAGTGQLESSDSTDDRWWDCARCEGTGRLKERRRVTALMAENARLREESANESGKVIYWMERHRTASNRLLARALRAEYNLRRLADAAAGVPIKQRDRTSEEQARVEQFTAALVDARAVVRGDA